MPNLAKLESISSGENDKTLTLSALSINLCLSLLESYAPYYQWRTDEDGTFRALTDEERDRAESYQSKAIVELLTETTMVYIGEVRMFAGEVPDKWLVCDGRAVLRDDYPELFAEIGVGWGSTNGDNFLLPDSRQSSPQGVYTGVEELAQTVGTLTLTAFPQHTHAQKVGTVQQVAGTGGAINGRSAHYDTISNASILNPTDNAGTAGGIDPRGPRFTLFFAIYAGR